MSTRSTPVMGITPELFAARSPEDEARRRYPAAREQIRRLVAHVLPRGSIVAVVSKGDAELVRLDGCVGWHFPRGENDQYAGLHPADGESAVRLLEQVRNEGADYFLVPTTYSWWLEHYRELAEYLDAHCRVVADDPESCRIYNLHPEFARAAPPPPSEPPGDPRAADHRTARSMGLVEPIRALVEAVLPEDAVVLVASDGQDELLELGRESWHYPQDEAGRPRLLSVTAGHDAVVQLESLRTRGASYLVIPRSAFSWLSARRDLERHLQRHSRILASRELTCAIFELGSSSAGWSR